jgi:hypothetical protein
MTAPDVPDVLRRIGEVTVQDRTIRLYVDESEPGSGAVWLRRIVPGPVSDLGVITGLGTPDPKPDLPSDWSTDLVNEIVSEVVGAWEQQSLAPEELCTTEVEIAGTALRATTSPGSDSVGFWEISGSQGWVATVFMVGRIRTYGHGATEVEPRLNLNWRLRSWLGEHDSDSTGVAERRAMIAVAKRLSLSCNTLLHAPERKEAAGDR